MQRELIIEKGIDFKHIKENCTNVEDLIKLNEEARE
jgi:hypothetical protein